MFSLSHFCYDELVPSISYLDILVVVYVCQDIFLRDIVNYPPFNL